MDTEKYQEAERYNKMLLDANPSSITIWEKVGDEFILIDCNNRTLEFFEISSKEEIINNFDHFSPETQPCGTPSGVKAQQMIGNAYDNGNTRFEWIHCTASGRPFPTEIYIVRQNLYGKTLLFAYKMDVSLIKEAVLKEQEEFKRRLVAEAEMRAAEERAVLMLETMPLACFMTKRIEAAPGEPDFIAIDCNQAAVDLFGFKNKQDAIENYHSIIPKLAEDAEVAQKAHEDGTVAFANGHRLNYSFIDTSGNNIPCEVTMLPLIYRGEPVLANYKRDLREYIATIESLKRANAAEEESRAKTKFLARMSHEIRTPLNAVMGITEVQLQKNEHDKDTEEAFLRIYNSSHLLLAIINDILDLSKIEADKMEIANHVYEMPSLIIDSVQLNLMHIGSKQIEFELNVDENLPKYLIGDELRIKQILNNILSNAFKYTNKGHIRLSIIKEDAAEDGGVVIVFTARDTGVGMTQEQVDSLFSIDYTRFNVQSNRAIEGSGLGMNIAYQLVQKMGGEIYVDSRLGEGTKITVRIPQQVESGQIIGTEVAKTLENLESTQREMKNVTLLKRVTMPYGRVLVVDDVESNLFVAKGLLLPYKVFIETVSSGQAAVNKIEAGEIFDIIFMDHMMPEMDGMEAVRIIRGMGYTHPIVALTANTFIGQAEIFMKNGFDGFISKPIDITVLDRYLLQFVRDRHPEKARAVTDVTTDDAPSNGALSNLILDSFLRDASRAIDVIMPIVKRRPLTGDALWAYVVCVHGMKAALNNIGEREMSQISLKLERAGRTVLDETPPYLEQLKAIIENITEMREDEKTGGPHGISDYITAALREQFEKILAACGSLELEEAEATLKTLREENLPPKINALLDKIDAHLLLSEFDEIIELIRREVQVR